MRTKRLISVILVCVMLYTALGTGVLTSAASYDSSPLQNVYHRLTADEELTIGYIGGSVTNGSGSTNPETDSWRALTTKWFRTNFSDARITEKDMSIGGTGTIFALYRMERALLQLEGDAPDLVFIETAINDSYDGVSGNTLKVYMESVIKKIYAKNPKCNIVMVITGDITTMKNSHETGVAFRQEHRDIAQHYNIPVIDVGAYLYQKIYEENGNQEVNASSNAVWAKYFKDTVHPLNLGYTVYAEKISAYLNEELVNKTLDSNIYANTVMPSSNYMQNLLTDAYDVDFSAFDFEKNNLFRSYNYTADAITYKYLVSNRLGDTFTVKFKGTHFGLWTMSNSVPTKITYSIDGKDEQQLQIYRASSNFEVYMLAENLQAGEHTVKITHADSNYKFEIYSMLIAGDPSMSGDISFVDTQQDNGGETGGIVCETSGHKMGTWEVSKNATCDANGEEISRCTNSGCTHSETRVVQAKGHNFKNSTVTQEPTCTETGIETGVCTICGKKSNKPIAATGHKWGKWIEFSKANCTDKGIQNRSCTICKESEARYTSLGAHVFAEPDISVEATLYSKGIESGKCLYCDDATSQETTCGAIDKDTGISVSNDLGVFDEGTVLKVKVLSSQDKLYQSLKSVLPGEFKAYYIAAMLNKDQRQPNGNITLTLPIPTGHSSNSDVYFIDGNGKTTKLDAVVNAEGTAFIVETNTLGSFAVTKATSDTSLDNDVENSSILMYIIIACVGVFVVAAVVVIIVIWRKKKAENK